MQIDLRARPSPPGLKRPEKLSRSNLKTGKPKSSSSLASSPKIFTTLARVSGKALEKKTALGQAGRNYT